MKFVIRVDMIKKHDTNLSEVKIVAIYLKCRFQTSEICETIKNIKDDVRYKEYKVNCLILEQYLKSSSLVVRKS